MSFLPILGTLLSIGGNLFENSQNQQAQQNAQQNAFSQNTAAQQNAYNLQQNALSQALAGLKTYQQQNPNPILGMSMLQQPNQEIGRAHV